MESNQITLASDYTGDGGGQAQAQAVAHRQLLRRVAAGDELAFEELYRCYSRPLYNYLLRLVHEPPAAEELLQEVFLAVWRGAGEFRGQAQVRTWLYRIAHHRAVSWLRQVRPVSTMGEGAEWPSEEDPSDLAMEQWRSEQVRAALASLSTPHRAVLELTLYHGLSYAEVAAVTGCPVGTVKSRMSQARHCLAEALKVLGVEGL